MNCPRCAAPRPAGAVECPRCGVVYAKATRTAELPPPPPDQRFSGDDGEPPGPPAPPPPEIAPGRSAAARRAAASGLPDLAPEGPFPVPPPAGRRSPSAQVVVLEEVADGRFGPYETKLLLGGLAGGLLLAFVPGIGFPFRALVTLLHEIGHAAAGWILGHPSLPAFDFVYGGGLTSYGQFNRGLALLIAAGFIALGWFYRRNPKTLVLLGVLFLLWIYGVSAARRREWILSGAGHFGELVFAAVFLYRALAGVGWKNPTVERPLGSGIAFFVVGNSLQFCWRLRNDAGFLAWYREGKGGALMNDLEQIALDVQAWTGAAPGIEGVAGLLMILTLLAPIVAIALFLVRARVHGIWMVLRDPEG